MVSTDRFDPNSILLHPVTTEAAMKNVDENNTLVYIVNPRSSKPQIKRAVMKTFNVKSVRSINTLIMPNGKKKAYIRLPADQDAMDVATRMGISLTT